MYILELFAGLSLALTPPNPHALVDSAIVAIITVYDLMGVTRLAYSRSFDFQTYIWAAIIYLAIVELLRNVVELIERRLTRHLRR